MLSAEGATVSVLQGEFVRSDHILSELYCPLDTAMAPVLTYSAVLCHGTHSR